MFEFQEICQTYNELVVVVNGLKMGQQQLKTWQAKLSTQLMSTDLGNLNLSSDFFIIFVFGKYIVDGNRFLSSQC